MKISPNILAGVLILFAIGVGARKLTIESGRDRELKHGGVPKNDRIGQSRPDEEQVAIPFLGKVRFNDVVSDFPPGPWLKSVDPFASREVADVTATPFSEEEMATWVKPKVYYGENGEIVCAIFDSGLPAAVSLDGLAEQKLGVEGGLSIVRHGFPANVDVESSNDAFLKHSLMYWCMGAESEQSEFVIAPVIVKVNSTAGSLSGSDNSQYLGKEIPMILVRYGQPFAGSHAILTDSRFDEVLPQDRVRRTWVLRPYLAEADNGSSLPSVSGGVVLDEPELEAWEKIRTAKKPTGG